MIKPKRVWDSLQRTVRQGKKQVWDVNGEMKLNGGNKREEADSSQFQVYGKTYESPVEPFMTYDKGWSEEGGGGGDERGFGSSFSFEFYGEPEGYERQIHIILYDDQNESICTFTFIANDNDQLVNFSSIGYGNSPLANKVLQQENAWTTLCSSYASRFLYRFGLCPMYDDGKCPYGINTRGYYNTDENLYTYFVEYFSTGSTTNLFSLLESDGGDGSLYVRLDFRGYLMDSENWEEAEYDLIHNWDDNDNENAYFCKTPDGKNGIDLLGFNDSPECVAHGLFTLSYFYNDYEGLMENVFCHNFVIDQHPGEETWTRGDFLEFMFGKISTGIKDEKLGRVTDIYQEGVVGSIILYPKQNNYEFYINLMYQTHLTDPFIYFKEDEYATSCTGTEGAYGEKYIVIKWGTQGVGIEFFVDSSGLTASAYGPIEGYNKFQEVINTLMDEYSVQDIASILDLDNMTSSGSCAPLSTILSYLVLKGTGNVNNVVAWFRSAITGGDKVIIWEEEPQKEVSFDSIEGNGSYSIVDTQISEEIYSGDTPDPIYVNSGASITENGNTLTIGQYEITITTIEGVSVSGRVDGNADPLPATVTEDIAIVVNFNYDQE